MPNGKCIKCGEWDIDDLHECNPTDEEMTECDKWCSKEQQKACDPRCPASPDDHPAWSEPNAQLTGARYERPS